MIPVLIETLVLGTPVGPSIIILRPFGESAQDGRVLPIWIGSSEAASIGVAIEGISPERPMTHDLISSMLKEFDATLDSVNIERVEGTTFYAKLAISQGEDTKMIDARPSDSFALAIREGAPIYVDEQVMEVASFPNMTKMKTIGDKIQVEEFHQFIESVSPEDFLKASGETPSEA